MATFIQTILPSGRALRLERLTTRSYKAALERVAGKADPNNTAAFGMKLAEELLLSSFRGLTPSPVPVLTKPVDGGGDDVDVDAMLDGIKDEEWQKPTYENLVTEGPLNLLDLLSEPEDYTSALNLAQRYVIGGGQASALAGKVKLVSVG